MRKNWPYLLMLVAVLFVLYEVSEKSSSRDVDWSDNYATYSKVPFGCYVLSDYLGDMMDDTKETDESAYQFLSDSSFTRCNYVFVNDDFEDPRHSFSNEDVKALCTFVSRGNTVLVAGRGFGALGDSLNVHTGDPLFVNVDDTTKFGSLVAAGEDRVQANLVNPSLHLPKNTVFNKTSMGAVFVEYDSAKTTLLGTDGRGYANFISLKRGKGEFLLHCLPDAFGNFYAASPKTAPYLFRVLSYLPKERTFIDTHYKLSRVLNDDTRRYLLNEPALRLGYYVLIISCFIGLIFAGFKRRQRAVPVFEPPVNSTLEFVEQVGALYYRQGNHADIAFKKINYFLESLRTRFYLQTQEIDGKFLDRLSALSGVPDEEVKKLFALINYVRVSPVGEKELVLLEQKIREFNKKSKR